MTTSAEPSAKLIQPNAKNQYTVTSGELPLSCPMPGMHLWNSHPRVFLPIEKTGWAKCPYCSAEYTLSRQASSPGREMYIPKHFEETRAEVLHELIRSHPLGALVAQTPDGLEASHIPFEIDPKPGPHGMLRCHVARANPVWRALAPESEVLVLFQGAQSYVSPSAYVAKQEHGKVVPTWNYAVVHVYGRPAVTHDAQWLRKMVEDLTTRHEAGRVDPWKVGDAPAEYVDKMLQAIVGIEISITRLLGKWKVSQNRSIADRQGVIGALAASAASPEREMADLIGRTL